MIEKCFSFDWICVDYRSRILRLKRLDQRIGVAILVQERRWWWLRNSSYKRATMCNRIYRRLCRRDSGGRTGGTGAKIRVPAGCGERNWKRGWRGYPWGAVEEETYRLGRCPLQPVAGDPTRLCWRRRVNRKSGLPRWNRACSSLLSPCHVAVTILSESGSGNLLLFLLFFIIIKIRLYANTYNKFRSVFSLFRIFFFLNPVEAIHLFLLLYIHIKNA